MHLTLEHLAEVRGNRPRRIVAASLAVVLAAAFSFCPSLPELDLFALLAIGAGALAAGRLAGVGATLAATVATSLIRAPQGSFAAIAASLAMLVAGTLLAVFFGAPRARQAQEELALSARPDRLALPPGSPLGTSIAALTTGVRQVASGDLTKNLAVADGPLSELAISLNKLIYGMRDFLGTMHGQAQRLGTAGGELHETASQSLAVIEGGAIAQKQLEEGIVEQSQIVDGAAAKVRAMSDAITALAASAQQQTRTLDETALKASTMSASIEEVSAQVDSLLTISSETSLTADRGGTAIHTIVEAMESVRATIDELASDIHRLGANSAQIGDIVKVIDRIAEQTNLLALNAAIEAARAGEHGRGFAVVASEIRKLADGSVQATKEIAGHIGSTQGVIGQVTGAMTRLTERLEESTSSTDNASSALREIVKAVLSSNQQIGEISSVTRSMSENAFRVISAIDEITRSVAANLTATTEMSLHSGEVSNAFDAITAISSQNAASVEVLTYVNAEVTSAAQRILGSVEEMNQRATAIDAQLQRYSIVDRKMEETRA